MIVRARVKGSARIPDMRRWPTRKQFRRLALAALLLALVGFVGLWIVTSTLVGEPRAFPPVQELPSPAGTTSEAPRRETLRVLTLNLAHGRKDGMSHILCSTSTIQANLDDIAAVLRRERPDVVALQEADGPSIWSGSFHHVRYLAEAAAFRYFVRGEHVKGLKLSYGTALLSRLPIGEPRSFTFEPSPPTFAKGFLVATAEWPGESGTKVDIVSVHVDFFSESVRRRQAEEVVRRLSPRTRPLVVMGDLNSDWTEPDSTLRKIAAGLGLTAYRPDAPGLETFSFTSRRFDWILLSPELEFRRHEVLRDVLSDHLAIVAEIGLAGR